MIIIYILFAILLIILFAKISNFNYRLTVLESKFKSNKIDSNIVNNPVPDNGVISSAEVIDISNQAQVNSFGELMQPSQPANHIEPKNNAFFAWLKDDWLLKLGGFLLLIGLGWFTTYAIVNNWIGEFGRITLGISAGILILGLGSWRIKKYLNQGGIFLVVGSAIILLTIFAAREAYNMFTPLFALLLMFLSTAYISLVSVKYNAFSVALSGLVLAFLAPLLTNSPSVNEVGLFSYLFAITLGTIWIVAIRNNWGALIMASLIGVSFYSLPFISSYSYITDTVLVWFAYAFTAVFFLTSIINIILSKENDIKAFLFVAIGNGAFVIWWIMSCVPQEWQSSIIALWMVIFAIGSFIAFSVTKIRGVFYTYAGVALAMLLIATTIELKGEALIIAYLVESLLIPILIYFTTRDIKASTLGSFLIVLPTIMSLNNLDIYYRSDLVLSKDFFVVILTILAILSLGIMYRKIKTRENMINDFYLDNLFLITGSVYAYVLLWSVLHVGIYPEAVAITFSLIIFTIIGLVKYFYGISVNSKTLRNYGGIMIGFVILRLLFIDIWEMEMGVKVFVFILIGILLMSTAFISRKIKSDFVEKIN
jgi:uncharacterized membrane protein